MSYTNLKRERWGVGMLRKIFLESAPFAIRVLWIILIGVPACYVLLGSFVVSGISDATGSATAASWVQAIGAILAIVGAAAFPYLHEAKKDRDRTERLRRIILLLAQNQQQQLGLLHSTVFNAVHDFGQNTIKPYLEKQWAMKWPPHIEALSKFPISDLDPGQLYMLTEMKVGAQYAWKVCEKLPVWNILGDDERLAITQLKHYWIMADLTVALLDNSRPRGTTASRK